MRSIIILVLVTLSICSYGLKNIAHGSNTPLEISTGSGDNKVTDSITSIFEISKNDIVYGDAKSKIVFIEYFSPTCPHCAYYKKNIFPEIKKKYIDNNLIAYVTREFIANKLDLDASVLARCAKVDDYSKFVTVILEQQGNWSVSSKYRDLLTNLGQLGGISPSQYLTCLNDDNLLAILIDNSRAISKYPGFPGTPAFFIQGERYKDRYSVEALSSAIDKAIQNAK